MASNALGTLDLIAYAKHGIINKVLSQFSSSIVQAYLGVVVGLDECSFYYYQLLGQVTRAKARMDAASKQFRVAAASIDSLGSLGL